MPEEVREGASVDERNRHVSFECAVELFSNVKEELTIELCNIEESDELTFIDGDYLASESLQTKTQGCRPYLLVCHSLAPIFPTFRKLLPFTHICKTDSRCPKDCAPSEIPVLGSPSSASLVVYWKPPSLG